MFKKLISIFLSFTLIFTQPLFAQGVAQLNLGSYLSTVGQSIATDRFRPLHMRYFSYDLKADNFQLLLDKGDDKDIDVGNGHDRSLQEKTKVLMEYFQIGLSLPNDKFWVNLRPDAQDEMIDPELEKTDMGKIMLEADLQLKRDTAQATSPQTPEGKAYWDKLYKKAGELFGTENITIPTITRPWIVPGEVILRQGEDSAYIFKANMKVMLEHDYLVSRGGSRTAPTYQQYAFSDPRMKELNEYSSQLIRELIIPKLTKEVNTYKRYAALRQVFFSLVMARWFKDTFSPQPTVHSPQNNNSYVKLIDSHNLTNLTSKEAWDKAYYFNEYKKSFEQGEYNLKENIATPTGQVIRSYVSGGITGSSSAMTENITHNNGDPRQLVAVLVEGWERGSNENASKLTLIEYRDGKKIVPSNPLERAGGEENEAMAGSALMMVSDKSYNMNELLKMSNEILNPDKLKKHLEAIERQIKSSGGLLLTVDMQRIANIAVFWLVKKVEKIEESSMAQTAANIIKHIIGFERPGRPMPGPGGTTINDDGTRRIFLSNKHMEEIFSSIKKGIDPSSSKPYLASEALGVILFMAAESKIESRRIEALSHVRELGSSLLMKVKSQQEIIAQFLKQVEGVGAINMGEGEESLGVAKAIEDAQKSLRALQKSVRGSSSALMEEKPAEDGDFHSEEIEKLIKKIEQNVWAWVNNIMTILSKAKNSTDVNNGAFMDINKDINNILSYLNTFNSSDMRIKGKDIDEIVEFIYKKGASSKKFLVDILPEGSGMWFGGRFVTLNSSVFELKRLQGDWEKVEVDIEDVVKRITRLIGSAAETDIRSIVNVFREKINRNPTVDEVGEILGSASIDSKHIGIDEIVKEKIAEISASSSMATISNPAPKNAGGIDFRQMNYLVEPMGSFKDLRFGLPTLTSSALERIDLDKELASLRDMVKAGMVPSGERVKEYLAACFQKGKIEEKQDDLLVCLAEIYRLAEEENIETSPELRESLVIVDTGKFVLLPNNQRVGMS